MDYGVEVPSYRRVDSKKQTKKLDFENGLIGLLVVLASGVMISRVGFGFVEGLYLAPFGIGYFLSMVKKSDFKKLLLVYLAVNVGYLIGYSKGKDIIIYVSISTAILLCKIICNTLNKEFKNSIAFLAIVGVTLAVGLFIGEQSFEINLIFSLTKALLIIPVFYMLNYGIGCMQELNTNYFYSTEELISIAILSCLVVAGIGNFAILGIEIRTIIALAMVITIAYAAGSNVGAILGVTMGIIIGIANNDLLISTTMYSICGLIVGVFKETGKSFSILAYVISMFMMEAYTGKISIQFGIEVCLAAVIMFVVPANVIKEILRELNIKDPKKFLKSYPFELSGGMNQRAGIMMAMACNPKIILADEPTSALDVTVQCKVIGELMNLRKKFGTTIIIVSHNMGVISLMTDKALVMKDGKCVEQNLTENIFNYPTMTYTKELINAMPKLRKKVV